MTWWRDGAIYQVYPRSFQDSDGDGTGDLEGVRRRLPYLKWLGVDGVWLSPFYRSPMADFGYDISDHRDVDPVFGTLDDFDALATDAHRLGLKLILDYVPNHTSIEHPWFREHPEYYLWADEMPNNWVSNFGGPAWTRDDASGRFYYHAYLEQQPDLDWRNAGVRAAMLDVLRFWCERGADGFRIDALRQVIKDAQLRDNPANPAWRPGDDPYWALLPEFTSDRPELQDVIRSFRDAVGEERLLLGELYLPIERLMAYYASGLDMPANFHLLTTPWTARDVADLIERYEAALPDGAWPNWVLGNHDRPRLASRLPPGHERAAAYLLLTLRGTPTLYYGDEIGMRDVAIPPEKRVDPWAFGNRDPVRTPMQWDRRGSFTTAHEPWLPFAADHERVNVEAQRDDPSSLLSLYRRLLALRRTEPDLRIGAYRTLSADGDVLRFARGDAFEVTIDFGSGDGALIRKA
ncbi:MAG TPA: alpha-amylase family glycosyl hydrolase [Solirubrobacter sp.]